MASFSWPGGSLLDYSSDMKNLDKISASTLYLVGFMDVGCEIPQTSGPSRAAVHGSRCPATSLMLALTNDSKAPPPLKQKKNI